MSKVDYRNSSASKRARTDGGRREDDWTCLSCGNVNFSFRTTCNMRNCHQSRPVDHNLKLAGNPMLHSHGFLPPAPYAGSGAPSSMYMGRVPYGSSVYNGSPIPRYDVPLARGVSHPPYDYGRHFSGGSPYRQLPYSSPPPYSAFSGGMFGMPPPLIDQYGLVMPIGHAAMGPRIEYFSEEKSYKKDATRENDWKCPNCGNVNFSFRTVCNMRKCNTPKPGPQQVAKLDKNPKQRLPEGSWKCEKCNNVNFPFRNKCNRQNCGAEKPSEEDKSSPSETTNGNDQLLIVG